MRKTFVILGSLLFLAATNAQMKREPGSPSGDEPGGKLRKVDNKAFRSGEMIEYKVYYGLINAGTAKIEIEEELTKIGKRKAYHIVGTGKSRGTFDWFFKVDDRYETFVDTEGIFPWLFVRRVNEGGYTIEQDYTFFQHKNKVDNGKGKEYKVPHGIQDMLSAYYYARTIDMTNINIGDTLGVETFLDNEIYDLRIKYIGKDTITIDKGTFKCLKFVPIVQKGRVFNKEEDLTVWITDDENKIPVFARAKILVGSIKMELIDYTGLTNPLAKLE